MAKEQVVCNLVKTFFRPVAALATVSASCVESLPFCRIFFLFHGSIGIISFNSLFVALLLCLILSHSIQFTLGCSSGFKKSTFKRWSKLILRIHAVRTSVSLSNNTINTNIKTYHHQYAYMPQSLNTMHHQH